MRVSYILLAVNGKDIFVLDKKSALLDKVMNEINSWLLVHSYKILQSSQIEHS